MKLSEKLTKDFTDILRETSTIAKGEEFQVMAVIKGKEVPIDGNMSIYGTPYTFHHLPSDETLSRIRNFLREHGIKFSELRVYDNTNLNPNEEVGKPLKVVAA